MFRAAAAVLGWRLGPSFPFKAATFATPDHIFRVSLIKKYSCPYKNLCSGAEMTRWAAKLSVQQSAIHGQYNPTRGHIYF